MRFFFAKSLSAYFLLSLQDKNPILPMSTFTEQLYGKDFVQKLANFESELLKVEAKHVEWFKSRESKYPNQKHDTIKNHYALAYSQNDPTIRFGFMPDSDLPDNIRKECNEVFSYHFPKK